MAPVKLCYQKQNNLAAIDVDLFFDIVFLPWTAKPLISSLYAVKYKPDKKKVFTAKGTVFNMQH